MLESLNRNIVLTATLNNFEIFMAFINKQLSDLEIDDSDRIKILTASEEIIVNIINYAYNPNIGSLEIIFKHDTKAIIITFLDNGKPFNPIKKANTVLDISLEEREEGGLGILMFKKLMDEVKYEYKENKNRLTIIKHKSKKSTEKGE